MLVSSTFWLVSLHCHRIGRRWLEGVPKETGIIIPPRGRGDAGQQIGVDGAVVLFVGYGTGASGPIGPSHQGAPEAFRPTAVSRGGRWTFYSHLAPGTRGTATATARPSDAFNIKGLPAKLVEAPVCYGTRPLACFVRLHREPLHLKSPRPASTIAVSATAKQTAIDQPRRAGIWWAFVTSSSIHGDPVPRSFPCAALSPQVPCFSVIDRRGRAADQLQPNILAPSVRSGAHTPRGEGGGRQVRGPGTAAGGILSFEPAAF